MPFCIQKPSNHWQQWQLLWALRQALFFVLFVVFLNQHAKQGPVLFHSISACWRPPIHLPGITHRKRSSKADSEREDVTRGAHNSPMNLGEFVYSTHSSMEQLLFHGANLERLYRERKYSWFIQLLLFEDFPGIESSQSKIWIQLCAEQTIQAQIHHRSKPKPS